MYAMLERVSIHQDIINLICTATKNPVNVVLDFTQLDLTDELNVVFDGLIERELEKQNTPQTDLQVLQHIEPRIFAGGSVNEV
jgi:hypothetical protein